MSGPIDVLGLGAVAVDDLVYLAEYPRPDSKVRVIRRERHAGGLTGTALVAASRMGRRCAYGGVLGDPRWRPAPTPGRSTRRSSWW
jgi:sugar/nucleoside kinase (ribokinase family)